MKKEKDVLKFTKGIIKDLLKHLGVDADFDVEISKYENNEGEDVEFIDIKLDGKNLGVLIGYLGRNLSALQRVLGMMVNRKMKEMDEEAEYLRVVIDVSGYREGRSDHLNKFAQKVREEVLNSGQEVDMPSMSAYERRIVHMALSENDDVVTESFGEGRDRHVRVMPAGK
ncbi:MAG: R3H domain-containing nucleic acid-binding protein [bacterium]